jgi:hypothetical protein
LESWIQKLELEKTMGKGAEAPLVRSCRVDTQYGRHEGESAKVRANVGDSQLESMSFCVYVNVRWWVLVIECSCTAL